VKYVAADLYAKVRVSYKHVLNVVKPSVVVIAKTVLSISISVKEVFRPLHITYATLSYRLVKPSITLRATRIDVLTSVVAIFKIFSKYVRPHLPARPSFYLISRPSKPLVRLISSSFSLTISRSVVDVKKPFPSFRLVIRPARPSPSIVASNYPSVGVRKSP